MSNYMLMLENHLTPVHNDVLARVEAAAAELNVNVFVVGGALRDMIAGSPIRGLDFVVEGSPAKLVRALEHSAPGIDIEPADEVRKVYRVRFAGGATAHVEMARQERYAKTGGKPQVTAASIHEHLRGRDFTINSLALSLSRGSRGLFIDPNNGLADLQSRELRAVGNYTFYDQPVRVLRMLRFKVRLGFEIAEKTRTQFENALAAGIEQYISPEALLDELRQVAAEPNPAEVLHAWEAAGLLEKLLPGIAGNKLNETGLSKIHKAAQLLPFGFEQSIDRAGLLFHALTEKLTPKERTAFIQSLHMSKEDADAWCRLDARAKKLEKEIGSASLVKPSQVYKAVCKAPVEEVLFLAAHSPARVVQDRIRNYFQKYLPAAEEVTDEQVQAATAATPGTPKFAKAKAELIAKRLDSRPKKPPEPEPAAAPPEPPPPTRGPGRPPHVARS